MANRRRYRKKAEHYIIAIQLSLNTEGFTYHKWGAEQRCKPGDWIVNNQGDTYSVDKDVFAETYRLKQADRPGIYIKTNIIWAERATEAGTVATKEGTTDYKRGDYIVSNKEDGSDDYAVNAETFESMYEPVDVS